MTRRKITLVEFSPSGGLFQFAYQLGQALADLGHDVELVTGHDPELQPPAGGSFTVVPILPTWHPGAGAESAFVRKTRRVARGAHYLAAWGRLTRHLAKTRPDVIQWAEWRFAIDGFFVAYLAKRFDRGAMVDLAHSPLPLEEQSRDGSMYKSGPVLRRALRSAYRSMDAVLVLGDRSRQEMLDAWPDVRRVDVVPHGDESVYLRAGLPTPSQCRRRILLFGTLARYKGLTLMLDAFVILKQTMADAELVIAGPVADIDVDGLVQRVSSIDGAEVRPGYVPIGEVADLVGSARVMVAPYHRSNASGVVRVAHTLSRPVVVTRIGDLGASVDDGETGLVVPPDDPVALAGALQRLLSDPSACDRMGALGHERLMAEASWPTVAASIDRIYGELLEAKQISAAASLPAGT